MLSYMLPVEDKTSPRNLNLNLNLNGNANLDTTSESSTTKLINFDRAPTTSSLKQSDSRTSHQSMLSTSSYMPTSLKLTDNNTNCLDNNYYNAPSILSTSSSGMMDDSKKVKMTKIGNTKNVTLKRVSFGSSKGSMVETLVFETPTPLPEHAEREFSFSPEMSTLQSNGGTNITTNHLSHNSCLDDSGIEMQEELERSKVRVSFFHSGKPQQISPPDNHIGFFDTDNLLLFSDYISANDPNSLDTMTAATAVQPAYDRQMSTESGWDNPFRPGGDLSREADEIVNMIKGGKPITPTGEGNQHFSNGTAQTNHIAENGTAVVDGAIKAETSQLQSTQNGTKSPQKPITNGDKKNGDTTSPQTQISNQVIPGPQSASHVVIEDKKKKKCTCCVIQ